MQKKFVVSPVKISKSSIHTLYAAGNELDLAFYDFQLRVSSELSRDLSTVSVLSSALLLGAGLLSALSPCSLALLPLSLSFITKGDSSVQVEVDRSLQQSKSNRKVLFFVGGSLAAFTFFGFLSSSVGSVLNSSLEGYGYIKDFSLAALYIIMGLSLLEIVPINFSEILNLESVKNNSKSLSDSFQAFVFGGLSALVGSSCTTPVLSSILALIASNGDLATGSTFLLLYGIGYMLPLLALRYLVQGASVARWGENFQWINEFFACLLLGYGGYLTSNLLFSLE
jgi:cytochrome c-type biogenesis protein